jgi:translation initiation factor IF-3
MKYRLKIGPGDFETKTRKVAGFLSEGHKVKITIMFRGREVERPQFGQDILNRIADTVTTVGKVESMPRLDGRNMVMVLAPDRRAQAAAKDHAAKAPTDDHTATNGSAPADHHPNGAAPAGDASPGDHLNAQDEDRQGSRQAHQGDGQRQAAPAPGVPQPHPGEEEPGAEASPG